MADKRSSSRFAFRACSFLRLAFHCRSRFFRQRLACRFVRLAFLCRRSSDTRPRVTRTFVRFGFLCSSTSVSRPTWLTRKPTLSSNCFKAPPSSSSTLNGESRFSCSAETPVSRCNLHGATRNRPAFLPIFIPCINATADVKDDFFIYDHGSYRVGDLDDDVADENQGEGQRSRWVGYTGGYGCSWKEEDVDRKAGEFIAQFRKQLEFERHMTCLRFEEMHNLKFWSSSVCSRSLTEKPTLSKNCFKTLRPSNSTLNGEREFSCCTETPAARLNLHGDRRNWPCLPFVPGINATADVKDDSFFIFDHGSCHGNDQDEDVADENRLVSYKDAYGCSWKEEDVDRKADEFIAQFRKQLELERKMSFLRFEEMLERGAR
ncbi:hypothetical protein EJ110_NYTH17682 [Nymphaea thermarum]|nr:hypothetical protein EJ110_NYTH17682 [Nymphaea thermarum]